MQNLAVLRRGFVLRAMGVSFRSAYDPKVDETLVISSSSRNKLDWCDPARRNALNHVADHLGPPRAHESVHAERRRPCGRLRALPSEVVERNVSSIAFRNDLKPCRAERVTVLRRRSNRVCLSRACPWQRISQGAI